MKNQKIIGRKSLPPFTQLEKEPVKHNINQNELNRRLVEAWRSPQKTRFLEDGVVKEITEKPDLSKIPILTHFEKDAGPYITSVVIHAKNVDSTRPLSKPKEKFEREKNSCEQAC